MTQNWKQRWRKLKRLVKKRRGGTDALDSSSLLNERDNIFNSILALYAGEDLDVIFEQLETYADRYPEEIDFYIPQLCTYLFHVSP